MKNHKHTGRSQASKRVARGSMQRVVSLRQYLEANLRSMEVLVARWKCGKEGRRYWQNGARKIKGHLKTLKAITRAAQANEKLTNRPSK